MIPKPSLLFAKHKGGRVGRGDSECHKKTALTRSISSTLFPSGEPGLATGVVSTTAMET